MHHIGPMPTRTVPYSKIAPVRYGPCEFRLRTAQQKPPTSTLRQKQRVRHIKGSINAPIFLVYKSAEGKKGHGPLTQSGKREVSLLGSCYPPSETELSVALYLDGFALDGRSCRPEYWRETEALRLYRQRNKCLSLWRLRHGIKHCPTHVARSAQCS